MGNVDGVHADAITKRQYIYAFGLVTSLFFLWGFSYGLIDVLNAHFQVVFGITKLQATGLTTLYFGAYIIFAPVAGFFASRFGYKKGIYLGLGLFSSGAVLFWPCAVYRSYGGFLGATFIIGCGLCTLEVMANSYIAVLGKPEDAAFRLSFAQSFNGLAAFSGPLIASKYFFSDGNETSLTNVQFVYLAVSALGLLIAVLFFFATLPEISESVLQEEQLASGLVSEEKGFFTNYHTLLGFATQFAYVGAQVCVASFAINYLSDTRQYTSAQASQLFAGMQICFMAARFLSTPLLKWFDPALILVIYGTGLTVFTLAASFTGGKAGLACLFIVFFFESICYSVIFTLGTQNLGRWTKRGAGLLVAGVGGGAVFPPMQGAIADHKGTVISYLIPTVAFALVPAYGVFMRFHNAKMKRIAAEKLANVETPTSEKGEEEYKLE